MYNESQIIKQTRCWVEAVVVGMGFCPFARHVMEMGTIHYRVVDSEDMESCLQQLVDECIYLDSHHELDTSLLVFPGGFESFEDYLPLLELSETLLEQRDYEGVYQIASFHPGYRFKGTDENDVANYTNRSPWPMLHLIRESSMEQALRNYPNPERIPQHNIELARSKGEAYMRNLLEQCQKLKD